MAAAAVGLVASTLVGTVSTSATTGPLFEPDSSSRGSVKFYDSAGNRIYGGSESTGNALDHIAEYLGADSDSTGTNFTRAYAVAVLPTSSATSSASIASIAVSSGVATYTTTGVHGFLTDQRVTVTNTTSVANAATFVITDVPTSTTFTVSNAGGVAQAAAAGTAKVPFPYAFPTKTAASQTSVYPFSTGPDSIKALTGPVVQLASGDLEIGPFLQNVTPDTTEGYGGYLQIRIFDRDPVTPGNNITNRYWESTISYDTVNNSWAVVYPAPPQLINTTVTTPTTDPVAVDGQIQRQVDVTLSTTVNAVSGVTAHPAGTVTFSDGSTDPATSLGAASYNTATGVASLNIGKPDDGAHHYIATFTPTDTASFSGDYNNDSSLTNPPLDVVIVPLPSVFSAPTVSGTAKVNSTVACSRGVWSNASTYSYAWYYGATTATVTTQFFTSASTSSVTLPAVTGGKYVKCQVKGANISGPTDSAPSANVKISLGSAPTIKSPTTTNRPKISGVAKVGKVLTAVKGTWSPTGTYTYSYVWKRYPKLVSGKPAGTAVKVGTAKTYKAVVKDKAKYLVLTITATRSGYSPGIQSSVPLKIS